MIAAPRLCWILINAVPYHHARLRAAAEHAAGGLCMVQLAGRDAFRPLQHQGPDTRAYERHVLFPDKRWQDIDKRSMASRLQGLLSRLQPAAVCINGWSYGGCIAALSWCLANRVPAILMSESTLHDRHRTRWKEAVKRRIVRLCSASLVGGRPHRDYMLALGAPSERIFSGYDVVDNEYFRIGADLARRAEQNLRHELCLPRRFFLACSRFEEKKNLVRLMLAYARYRRIAGEGCWSLVIVGDGILRERLLALRAELGLEAHVLLPGSKGYEELPAYYGLASAFVHASTTEQWGLVVNEAMAAGLPILVSDRCGCAPDLLQVGFNGWHFDPQDEGAMAHAMVRMADGSCDRNAMGRNSREIIARWSLARFVEGLNEALTAALRSPVARPSGLDRLLLWSLRTR
jgi:glycosyltransferase involved in cell wall biosynthesis